MRCIVESCSIYAAHAVDDLWSSSATRVRRNVVGNIVHDAIHDSPAICRRSMQGQLVPTHPGTSKERNQKSCDAQLAVMQHGEGPAKVIKRTRQKVLISSNGQHSKLFSLQHCHHIAIFVDTTAKKRTHDASKFFGLLLFFCGETSSQSRCFFSIFITALPYSTVDFSGKIMTLSLTGMESDFEFLFDDGDGDDGDCLDQVSSPCLL